MGHCAWLWVGTTLCRMHDASGIVSEIDPEIDTELDPEFDLETRGWVSLLNRLPKHRPTRMLP
jgi:hypothetical protein